MPNLGLNKVDPTAAAELVRKDVQEILPSAGVQVTTIGDPNQPSVREAMGQAFSRLLARQESTLFSVVADFNAPRPVRVVANYVGVGRGAGPISILYLARLKHRIPAAVAFRRGRFRNGTFDGEPNVARALSGVPRLDGAIWKLLQAKTVFGNIVFTIEPSAELAPDDDGAILIAFSAPARRKLGLGGIHVDTAAFLDIANGIEIALPSAAGVTPAPTLNVPLPS